MPEWEKKATDEKTHANAVLFFNDKMTSTETYQENSGNSAKRNGFESANVAVKIADLLKELLKKNMGSNKDDLKKSKAEHPLQIPMLRTSNHRQHTEMKDT